MLLSSHGNKTDRVEFSFPAIVCSSFALELFLKFFLGLGNSRTAKTNKRGKAGHEITGLWDMISPDHQHVIAGMFHNSSGIPATDNLARRKELFEDALKQLDEKPFVHWRYIHELKDISLMSHSQITEVVDALGYAAQYLVKSGI